MLKRLVTISLATFLGSTVPLSTAELSTPPRAQETPVPEVVRSESTAIPEPTTPEPTTQLTTTPAPTPVVTEKSKPVPVPTSTSTPVQTPDDTPQFMYVEGFGYIECGGPNQCTVADSDGDINKMVGYMGDGPEPTATPEKSRSQIHYPDDETQIDTEEKIYINEE